MALPSCTLDGCAIRPPAMDAFTCSPSPTDGEVTEILLTSTTPSLAVLSDAEDLAALIDNTAASETAIVRLKVTGKVNAPDIQNTRVEGGQLVQQARKNFSIEADFFNDSSANYEAVRKLMHCGKPLYAYYVMGGYLYGGTANIEDGINTFVNILPSSEGYGSYLKYTVRIAWEATCPPARRGYVLAA